MQYLKFSDYTKLIERCTELPLLLSIKMQSMQTTGTVSPHTETSCLPNSSNTPDDINIVLSLRGFLLHLLPIQCQAMSAS